MPIGAVAAAQELRARQRVRDQQDVLHPGVKRGGDLTEQQAGGLDIQRHRQVPGAGIGVELGLHRRQRGRGRGYLVSRRRPDPPPPGCGRAQLSSDAHRGERCPAGRQRYRLTVVVLGPGDVEVFEQDPPGHRVDGEVVDDQRQLAGVGRPTAR